MRRWRGRSRRARAGSTWTASSVLRRGHLYWASLDKRRPVLVVSPDYRNERARDVIVVPCATRLRFAPTHVALRKGEGGLAHPSVLQCEQVSTLPRDLLEETPLGVSLSVTRLDQVIRAILRAVGVPVE